MKEEEHHVCLCRRLLDSWYLFCLFIARQLASQMPELVGR